MDRQAWLDQRRAAVLASYDQDAPTYDDHGYPAQTQRNWVARLLERLSRGRQDLGCALRDRAAISRR